VIVEIQYVYGLPFIWILLETLQKALK